MVRWLNPPTPDRTSTGTGPREPSPPLTTGTCKATAKQQFLDRARKASLHGGRAPSSVGPTRPQKLIPVGHP